MKNNLLDKIKNNKSLISNFSYLSFLQFFNLALPLFTYPYLINVLGKETYGITVLAQSIIGYFLILISFGFNISATKEVSIYRDDKEKLSEIVSSIFIIKGILLVVSFIILYFLISYTNTSQGYSTLFYLTFWMCIYEWIFPTWYFQGIEKMKYITILSLISRLIFLVFVFVFIKKTSDYILFPIINGIGAIVSGIIGLYVIFYLHKIKFSLQKAQTLLMYFKESVPMFVSQSSVKIYVNSNKVVIGYLLGLQEVAYYDLAEKIVTVLKTPQAILGQVLFPKINKDRNINFIKKMFNYSVSINFMIVIIGFIFIKYLILLLGGETMLPAINVFYGLSFTVPIAAISNIFGIQLLIPFGYTRKFTFVIVSSGLFYLLIVYLFWLFGVINLVSISLVTLLTEMFVTLFMYYYVLKFNLWKNNSII